MTARVPLCRSLVLPGCAGLRPLRADSPERWRGGCAMARPFLRTLLVCTTLALAAPAPAAAATVTEQIVAQLADQGFKRIRVSRTLLGRARIVATSRDYSREIVVNPATGEILRDYIRPLRRGAGATPTAPQIVDPYEDEGEGGSGLGGSGSGRDDDDEDDDDDEGDDDDGEGGGDNSGPGGGGDSGSGGDDGDDGDESDDDE